MQSRLGTGLPHGPGTHPVVLTDTLLQVLAEEPPALQEV